MLVVLCMALLPSSLALRPFPLFVANLTRRTRSFHSTFSASSSSSPATASSPITQVLVCSRALRESPEMAKFAGPFIVLSKEDTVFSEASFECLWSAHRGSIQIDSCELELFYLGDEPLPVSETVRRWEQAVSTRLSSCSSIDAGPGGIYQKELNIAHLAVHKASHIARSLQRTLLKGVAATSKEDRSPVTIADFAVQVLIIEALSEAFPGDRFIAEESSQVLREDEVVRLGVLQALADATGRQWSSERLYEVIDLGTFEGKAQRVWVLDPIDGTKGFMRGEHFCIALALLVDGSPVLSVMGCPNLSLKRSLEGTHKSLALIDAHVTTDPTDPVSPTVYSSSSGCVFFAVSGQGAYARSLTMEPGAAIEMQVSARRNAVGAVMCESAEAAHGNRGVTLALVGALGLDSDLVRIDGQCKYCLVGAGAADGNVRLPPLGYLEKIWDHAAGSHFVEEAGGRVTDLKGEALDFSGGRHLSAGVQGVLSSNGALHSVFLDALRREYEQGLRSGSVRQQRFMD